MKVSTLVVIVVAAAIAPLGVFGQKKKAEHPEFTIEGKTLGS